MSEGALSNDKVLAQFQNAFAENLWAPSGLFERTPDSIAALVAQPGFAVYRNTVMKGCIDALEANYPAVSRLVGSDWFRAAAALHAKATPPGDSRLMAYGAGFAEFLRNFEPAAHLPYLADVARLDRCWVESHVAADALPLTPQTVTQIDAAHLGAVALTPHPAARWAWFDEQPIYSIWAANRAVPKADAGAPPELVWRGEGALLTRAQGAVVWRLVDRGAVAFLDACASGEPLATAAEAALAVQPDTDLSSLFAGLLTAGAFTALPAPPGQE